MQRKGKGPLLILLLAFFIGQALLQSAVVFPRWKKDYAPKGGAMSGLGPDQMLLALAGFRELIAGILWVKADSFFENGNYDAILPIIRLVTWLDPHQIDVYSTGMWHIAYNFTDEEHRSDRRYIPSAIKLGKEGAAQNDKTYELFFETGWIWYHKIDDDYPQAIKWFKQAMSKPDIIPGRKSLLSNAYARNNQLNEALDNYYQLYAEAVEEEKKGDGHGNFQTRETIENNIDTMIVRMVQRGWLANERGEYEKGDYDTKPPHDVKFSARVSVEEPAVIRVTGTYDVLPVGSRIRVVLRDENLSNGVPGGMNWDSAEDVNFDPQKDVTFMQDQAFVKARTFNRRIDMSKDLTMYPFSAKSQTYLVEFFYDPRSAPHHIQDKFGFNAEGFTDKNFISTTARPGHKVLYVALKLTRDQILRRGEWSMAGGKTPVVSTPNFKESAVTKPEDDVIIVPSILSEKGTDPKKM